MAYNKAKAEQKWRHWKEVEEKQLRDLGASEETITQLRNFDKAIFNSDRGFYRRIQDTSTYIETVADDPSPQPRTVDDFLNGIDNPQLYETLANVDKLSLVIVLMKEQGYTTHEIASCLGLTEKAIYRRIDRLKEKLKNFL